MSARKMFYSSEQSFTSSEEKSFARGDLVYNVTEDILVLLENNNISKTELAKRLGRSRSYVTQLLSGARNMTLGSLSDICFVIGVKPIVVLKNNKQAEQFETQQPVVVKFPNETLKRTVLQPVPRYESETNHRAA